LTPKQQSLDSGTLKQDRARPRRFELAQQLMFFKPRVDDL